MIVERLQKRAEDPSSEAWLEYYRDAKVRRRSRPHAQRTRTRLKRWRNRQRSLVVVGFLAVGAVVGLFYLLLVR
ncbi:MAG: hypothetical protein JWM82_1824 [Myxococcales bacterium]|nr:hypothetical protein [Myxococcales bacterium]